MKNKQASRAKKKRRLQKEAERKQRRDEIVEKIQKTAKKHGLKNKYKKEELWRAFNEMDKKMIVLSIVYTIISVSYCLRKIDGWGQTRIIKYIQATQKYITIVGQNNRNIPALKEELKIDAGIDCDALFKDYQPFAGQKVGYEKFAEGQVLFQKIEYIFPMVIYSLYFDSGWKQKRMNRLSDLLKDVIIGVIERNEIDTIKTKLYNECKIKFCDDGRVYVE